MPIEHVRKRKPRKPVADKQNTASHVDRFGGLQSRYGPNKSNFMFGNSQNRYGLNKSNLSSHAPYAPVTNGLRPSTAPSNHRSNRKRRFENELSRRP